MISALGLATLKDRQRPLPPLTAQGNDRIVMNPYSPYGEGAGTTREGD